MGKNKDDDVKGKPDEVIADKRGKRVGITEDEIAESLRHFLGLRALTADFLGCSEANLSARIQRSPYLQEVVKEVADKRLDDAEMALHKLISQGNFNAIWKYLTTHGKHRGYIETSTNQYSPEMLSRFLDSMRVIESFRDPQSNLRIDNNNNNKTEIS